MRWPRTLSILFLLLTTPLLIAQRLDPESPEAKLLAGLRTAIESPELPDDLANTFAMDDNAELESQLSEIREMTRGRQPAEIRIMNNSAELHYERGNSVVVVTATVPDGATRIQELSHRQQDGTADGGMAFRWEGLEDQLNEVLQEDFDGSVLIVRDGKPFLEKSFGFANREKQIPIDENTVFAIGSCPIDFTKAGILLLKDRDQLQLSDPISKFFDNVPADKQDITLEHLMTGRSGLRDFHDLPSDDNADHTWIDRAEAVRRILQQELLFAPGTQRQHSHSAWGLLAAVIEVVSEQTYPAFTREHLFQPAGMKDTGFFGEPIPEQRVAVGYGYEQSSTPNSPPHWGKTSWLVMGSGGQVSTLRDICRWELAIRKQKILSPESTKIYVGPGDGVSSDGDMFGFEFMHSRNPKSMFLLISNAVDSDQRREKFTDIGRGLYRLVRQSSRDHDYSVGIALSIAESDEGVSVIVEQVVPGGAAEKAGLKPGDRLMSANDQPLGDEAVAVLDPLISTGQKIRLKIQRGDTTQMIKLVPIKKK